MRGKKGAPSGVVLRGPDYTGASREAPPKLSPSGHLLFSVFVGVADS